MAHSPHAPVPASGALATIALRPKLVDRMRRIVHGQGGFGPPNLFRDSLPGGGNDLRVRIDMATGGYSMTVPCGLSSLFQTPLVLTNLRSRIRG